MPTPEAIKKYYSDTQFEYKLIWNWRIKDTPALHFGYYDEKATNMQQQLTEQTKCWLNGQAFKKVGL